jgi:hypothetical protein
MTRINLGPTDFKSAKPANPSKVQVTPSNAKTPRNNKPISLGPNDFKSGNHQALNKPINPEIEFKLLS